MDICLRAATCLLPQPCPRGAGRGFSQGIGIAYTAYTTADKRNRKYLKNLISTHSNVCATARLNIVIQIILCNKFCAKQINNSFFYSEYLYDTS